MPYGLLAEVALSRSQWKKAKEYSELAIAKNNEPDVVNHVLNSANQDWSWSWKQYQGLYLLLLAKSQKGLKQLQEAIKNLEKAREDCNPQYDPQLYIDILDELRLLYFQQGQYLEAFEIKLEQGAIQAEYGFRPFIGAGSLRPLKRVINPAIESADPKVRAQQRLSASGRLQDINNLLERIGRNDYKLIVIHGLSGVGKSSLLWAGLTPSLKDQAIGDRDALPVMLRFYTNWVSDLGEQLVKALSELEIVGGSATECLQSPKFDVGAKHLGDKPSVKPKVLYPNASPSSDDLTILNSPEAIIQQLRINAERNLLTVLIFDQFEEFFFVCTDLLERRKFYQFLQICLNLPFVKVVMSLREEYLHYLLECARLTDLDVINNNILDKSIRYYLGDFSPERAKSVIRELTERSQFYLAPELIDEMVKDLAGELGEIRPIELQVVGAQLQTDNITTLEKYRQLGANPKEKLVQLSLEEVVKDCGTVNERAAQLVLYFLTNETGTRPLKTRDELMTDFETVDLSAEVGKLELVLQVLVGSGLVFQIPDAPADRYQLVHDYLVSFIRQSEQARKVDERKNEKQQRQLIEAKLNQVLKQRLRLARTLVILFLGSTISAVWFGLEATKSAINAELDVRSGEIQRILSTNQEFEALIESLKTAKELKQKFGVESDTRMQFAATFQQAVYTVRERNRLEGHSAPVYERQFQSGW
ncbi:MAG: ATP-binding protein [Potamolinea sp.]